MKRFTVTAEEAGKRLDIVLSAELGVSRAETQRKIDAGDVMVNDKEMARDYRVQVGDIIIWQKAGARAKAILPPELKVIHENDDFLIVDKPAGLLVHPNKADDDRPSLVGSLIKKYPKIKKIGEDPLRPGIMHRLDKDVSGLMVVAKTAKAFDFLKQAFVNRQVHKEYIALVYGKLPKDQGRIDLKIAHSKSRGRMVARPEGQEGKEAITEFDVIERLKTVTLARVRTLTGRTHQIRTHFYAINHPLVGDPLYKKTFMRHIHPIAMDRVFLHAASLTVPMMDGTEQRFESPLPEELEAILKTLPRV